jgi:hypothetical protein
MKFPQKLHLKIHVEIGSSDAMIYADGVQLFPLFWGTKGRMQRNLKLLPVSQNELQKMRVLNGFWASMLRLRNRTCRSRLPAQTAPSSRILGSLGAIENCIDTSLSAILRRCCGLGLRSSPLVWFVE